MMNNVDIAIAKIRELQTLIFDNDTSSNKLFEKTQQIILCMEKASIEISANYAEISRKLTAELNSGKRQE